MILPYGPILLPLYGPFAIHSYGLFIALGIIISARYMYHNRSFKALHIDHLFIDIITVSIMAGIIGGRALEVLSNPLYYPSWYDRVALWEGGFSALGSIIGVMIITPLFLRIKNIPILPLLDCAALYAPLFQAIARIGCLFSGCCHGTPTDSWLSITYTHYSTNAICNIAVHPTQLYSTILLFGIFLLLVLVIQPYTKKAGQLFCTYIALASLERFFVDFWRHDRIFIGDTFSFHQLIALILCSFSVCMLYIITYTRHPFSKISSL